jgi:hypothetical protein
MGGVVTEREREPYRPGARGDSDPFVRSARKRCREHDVVAEERDHGVDAAALIGLGEAVDDLPFEW